MDARNQDFIIGLVGLTLQIALLALLLYRKAHRRFPLFATNTVYSIVVSITHFWAAGRSLSFVVYLGSEVGYSVLALLALHEIFQSTLAACYRKYPWSAMAIPLSLLAILGNAVWQGIHQPLGAGPYAHSTPGVYAFVRGTLWLQVAALVFGLWRKGPTRWGAYRLGIFTAFGGAAAITLVAYLMRSHFGAQYEDWFRFLPAGAYFGKLFGWIGAFLGSDRPTGIATQPKQSSRDPQGGDGQSRLLLISLPEQES